MFNMMGDIGFISTAQKLTFSIKDFLSNCDQMSSFVQIFSHLMKKFLMENIIFVQCSLRDPIHVQEYNRSKETRNMLRLFLKKSCIQKASGAEKKPISLEKCNQQLPIYVLANLFLGIFRKL